jgi:hypothetical protein
MAIEFRKATRTKAKLRLALCGPAGSGKTRGALLIAKGMGLNGKVAFIDTENGSGDLYSHVMEYDILTLDAPYHPERFIAAIKAAEEAGYELIIIDSLSHAWAGVGGILEIHGNETDKQKTANTYTAWRNVTPLHNKLVEAMLASKCHIIATMRSKQEYVQEKNDAGKTIVKKLGMAPVMREGIDYEFTFSFDIEHDHLARVGKARADLFDSAFRLNETIGTKLFQWLNEGEDAPEKSSIEAAPTTDEILIQAIVDAIDSDIDADIIQAIANAKEHAKKTKNRDLWTNIVYITPDRMKVAK